MGVYNSRFHTLSALIRKLHDEYVFEKHIPPEWKKQLKNLRARSINLKYSIGCAGIAFLFDMLTVFALYLDFIFLCQTNIWTLLLFIIFVNNSLSWWNFCFNSRIKISFVRYEDWRGIIFMKINAIRAFIIASIVIILLYALGLFLPIILTSN